MVSDLQTDTQLLTFEPDFKWSPKCCINFYAIIIFIIIELSRQVLRAFLF